MRRRREYIAGGVSTGRRRKGRRGKKEVVEVYEEEKEGEAG